jgi:hypothetical protein
MTLHEVFYQDIFYRFDKILSIIYTVRFRRSDNMGIPAVSLCSKCNDISESDPNDVVHYNERHADMGPD